MANGLLKRPTWAAPTGAPGIGAEPGDEGAGAAKEPGTGRSRGAQRRKRGTSDEAERSSDARGGRAAERPSGTSLREIPAGHRREGGGAGKADATGGAMSEAKPNPGEGECESTGCASRRCLQLDAVRKSIGSQIADNTLLKE